MRQGTNTEGKVDLTEIIYVNNTDDISNVKQIHYQYANHSFLFFIFSF
jgi:hypothetical protein